MSTPRPIEDISIARDINHIQKENEISTFDLSSEHETQGENYYDASKELEELEPLE